MEKTWNKLIVFEGSTLVLRFVHYMYNPNQSSLIYSKYYFTLVKFNKFFSQYY